RIPKLPLPPLVQLARLTSRPPYLSTSPNPSCLSGSSPAGCWFCWPASAPGRADVANRGQNRIPLLGVAEENIVAVAEAVIHAPLITVRVVDRRARADEVIRQVARVREVGRRRVGLEELLHRREDQRLRQFVAGRADGLILLFLGIDRQRISRGITPEGVAHKTAARRTGRVRVVDLAAKARTCVAEIPGNLGGRRHVGQRQIGLAVA